MANDSTTSAKNFFCVAPQNVTPTFYEHQIKSCADGKQQVTEGTCMEHVACVYLNAQMQAQTVKEKGKAFASLSPNEKEQLAQSHHWDLLPSDLTCSGTKNKLRQKADGTAVYEYKCPQPENCKSDALFLSNAATFDSTNPDSFGLSPDGKEMFPYQAPPSGVAK
jgi:hypothetical protein